MAKTTRAELAEAKRRGDEMAKAGVATAAAYDEVRNRVVITLSTAIEIAFDPRRAQGLEHASADDLRTVEIQGAGFAVYWPKLDADIYIPALLRGVMGTTKWMAAQLGATGGKYVPRRRRRPGKTANGADGLPFERELDWSAGQIVRQRDGWSSRRSRPVRRRWRYRPARPG
jgi:hypothetical protein